jgi:hypothetical protein
MSKSALEQSIMSALSDDKLSAAALTDLIADTESAITEAEARAKAEAENAVDPMLSTDPRKARAASEDAAIMAGRLRTLLPRLQERARSVSFEAERREWQSKYDLLEHERNNLAHELKATYPKVTAQLVNLLNRIAINDNALSALHQSRPSGSKGQLLGAELVARNLKLPDWIESNRLAWPPRDDEPFAVRVAAPVATVHSRQRHSADWAEALTAETQQRKLLEQQRIADEAEHTAQQQREYERSISR